MAPGMHAWHYHVNPERTLQIARGRRPEWRTSTRSGHSRSQGGASTTVGEIRHKPTNWGRKQQPPSSPLALANMDEAEENFFLSGTRSKTTETVSVGGRERQRHFVIAKGTPRGFVAFSVEAQEHVVSLGHRSAVNQRASEGSPQ